MNIFEVYDQFSTNHVCIDYLESIRWADDPRCAHCESGHVARRVTKKRWGTWNCYDCVSTFTVKSGTMFHRTKIPLPTWFLGVCLIMNARKSISSYQLSRDLNMNQKTAWYMVTRIRAEMLRQDNPVLTGIIEMDETYMGGKPRKGRRYKKGEEPKRGRGTKKTPIVSPIFHEVLIDTLGISLMF